MRVKCRIAAALLTLIISLSLNLNTVLAKEDAYPKVISETAVLMDAKTGQVLFEKNMDKKEYPASITKIMTGMLALERGSLSDTLTMSKKAVFSIDRGSSHIALDVGEQLSLEQALYGMALESANDAANGVAEYISGDLESFAQLMTDRAKELGALHTNFSNANGLNNSNHYTTAFDMAIIMRQAIKTPNFTEIFSTKRYVMPPTNIKPERLFNSTNGIINGEHPYEGIIASKSGWTSNANHTLVTAAKRGDRELIAVVMNSQGPKDKYQDTIKLLDYGFNDFSEIVLGQDDFIKMIPNIKSNEETIKLIKDSDISISRLIYKDLSIDDVDFQYTLLGGDDSEKAKLNLTFKLKENNSNMSADMGSIIISQKTASSVRTPGSYILKGLKFLAISLIVLICVIALIILVLRIMYRRKIKIRNKYRDVSRNYQINSRRDLR